MQRRLWRLPGPQEDAAQPRCIAAPEGIASAGHARPTPRARERCRLRQCHPLPPASCAWTGCRRVYFRGGGV